MTRRLVAVASVFAGAVALATMPADAGRPPEPKLHPIDGAHWQAKVGLPDSRGNARQALAQDIDAVEGQPPDPVHIGLGAITGFEGQPTSAVQRVRVDAKGTEGGIIPCVRVAYIDLAGNEAEFMVTMVPEVVTVATATAPGGTAGWLGYAYNGPLPAGTIQAIEVGVHAANEPPDPGRVLFDNVQVNDHRWTHPGDNGAGH